jgi:polar amino acid transport system substrate-binding protein
MFRSATVGLVGEVGEPPHPLARVAAVVWFVIGICFVAAFTASLTTDLTIQQITGNIRSVNDLVGKRVVTVRDSTAARYLADRRIDFDGVDAVEDAFRRVEDGGADAVVFDAPVLQHYLQASGSDRLTLVGNVFQREDYGIALPVRSEHRKAVNEALLGMRVDGSYDRIVEHYFGRPQ